MTFIFNNLKWIILALVMILPILTMLGLSIFLIKNLDFPEYRPPLTFEEFKKRGLDKWLNE